MPFKIFSLFIHPRPKFIIKFFYKIYKNLKIIVQKRKRAKIAFNENGKKG